MPNFKSLMFCLLSISLLSACGSSGGGGDGAVNAAAIADEMAGTYYTAFTKNGSPYHLVAKIGPGNKVSTAELYFKSFSSAAGAYRESNGTFVKNGNDYQITWDYETCNPVKSQTVTITAIDPSDRIFAKVGNTTLQLLNAIKYKSSHDIGSVTALIEDVNCNLIPES